MSEPGFYPSGTEDFYLHQRCRKNLAGHHKGNRFCIDHKVLVKHPEDSDRSLEK